MKKNLIILLMFLFVAPAIFAQNNEDTHTLPTATAGENIFIGVPIELQNKIDKFYKTLIQKKVNKAYDVFLKDSPVENKKEQVTTLIDQTKRASELYGEMTGYEPVNSELVSESFIRVRYLGMHSKYPMRWIFTFYKSPDRGWIVVNIKFDDLVEYFFSDE